ncbi:hypothetical protein AeNC1_006127 [Aphanomyces euteiches]|nr:hypothetical protein AeNC1_006127 [Aphanomyces euteiches]
MTSQDERLVHNTPLHLASSQGYLDIVKALLTRGADVNIKNKDGCSPLHEASLRGHLDVVIELLRCKAAVDDVDERGKTSLHVASEKNRLEINGKSARDVGNRSVQSLFDTYQAEANFQSKPNSDQQTTYSIQSARKCISQALQNAAKNQSEELISIASDILTLSLEAHIHRESVLTTGLMVERILRHPILLGPHALSPVLQVLQDLRKLYQKTIFTVVPSKLQLNQSDRGKITYFGAILFQLQDQLRQATQNLKIDLNIQVVGDINDLSQEFGKAMETMRSLDASLQSLLGSSEQRHQRDGLSDLAIQLYRGLECYQRQVTLRNAPRNNDLESKFRLSQDKIEETLKIIRHTQNFPETFQIDATESWLLSSKDVEIDTSSKILGSGAFGTVLKGKYQGQDVAIKRFDKVLMTDSADVKKAIANEVRAWKKVSHEPYILTLFGVCVNTVTPTLVSELCQTNIRRYVRDRPETLIPLVYQFAKGLAAIHNAGIIHRDLKGDNVLVTIRHTVAIGDFGISRTATSLEKTTIGGAMSGTLNWMSPEQYLSPRRVTTKSDIWSFGMTLWEILCNDIPFRKCCEHEFKDPIFKSEDDRPAKPDHVTPALEPLWALITHCWRLNPIDRPTAIEIVKYLEIHYKSQLNINNGSYASTEHCVQSIEWADQLKLTDVQTEEIPDFFHSGVDVNEPWIDTSQTMNHLMEVVNMASGSDSISSQGQQDDGAQLEVYSFDLSKYKNGSYKLITAVDPMDATRKTKVNTVQFDWPHSSFSIHVKHARSVGIRLNGEDNYFNVFVDVQFTCILRATVEASCYNVAQFYNDAEHTITISKRTEPQVCGTLSTFKVCTFYGFIVDEAAVVLPYVSPYTHRMEFIVDSETCGYGNEGAGSSSNGIVGMKGRFENVYNGYACITARMFNAEAHVLAWSGKGVKSNFADWGPNMSSLWKNTIASRDFPWDMDAWQPEVVVVNLGTQDLFPPASSKDEIVEAYIALLKDIRMYRPDAHIFCVVCDENCISGEEDHENRRRISLQLQVSPTVSLHFEESPKESPVEMSDDEDYQYGGGIRRLRPDDDVIPTLYEAALNGRLDLIREMGQSVALLVKDSNGNTPLHAAAKNGHVDIVVELLSRGADVNLKNKHGQTALHEAADSRHFDVVKTLLDNGALVDIVDSTGGTPLHEAAENGHLDITTLLLEHKAQVDVLNNKGDTPLHWASQSNHLDVVKVLLAHGANVDAANNELWTSLHLAAMKGYLDVVKELLAQNATLDVIDDTGNTPLHKASKHGNMDIVKLLAYADANKHLVNNEGRLALDLGDEAIQTFLESYNEMDDTPMSIRSATQRILESLEELSDSSSEITAAASGILSLSLRLQLHREQVLTTGLMIASIVRRVMCRGGRDAALLSVLKNIQNYWQSTILTTQTWKLQLDNVRREERITSILNDIQHFQGRLREIAANYSLDTTFRVMGSIDDIRSDIGDMMDKMNQLTNSLASTSNAAIGQIERNQLVDLAVQIKCGLDYYELQVKLHNMSPDDKFENQVASCRAHIEQSLQRSSKPIQFDKIEMWRLSSDDVKFDPDDLKTALGRGACATVFKGTYRGQPVAVKHFDQITKGGHVDWDETISKEIETWKNISKEKYILTLHGVCTTSSVPILVCELCKTNIRRYVRDWPEALIPSVYQFALGLASLHNADIIHRDIKSDNVLITQTNEVAIADFGLSRTVSSFENTNTGIKVAGTMNWMSPEHYFRSRKVTKKADIWSFGMTLWEILCNETPFANCSEYEFKDEIFQSENDRPAKPEDLDPKLEPLWTLITKCWRLLPEKRPTADEIVEDLMTHYKSQIQESLKPQVGTDQQEESQPETAAIDSVQPETVQLETAQVETDVRDVQN